MIKDIGDITPGEAFECVLDHDRAYFERNPNARKYVRLPLPGEFDAYPAALEAVRQGWRVRVTPLWQSPDGVVQARKRELVPPPSSTHKPCATRDKQARPGGYGEGSVSMPPPALYMHIPLRQKNRRNSEPLEVNP